MRVKNFIFWSPSKIKGLTPIRTAANKYGGTAYFYLINNSNLKILRDNEFKRYFKDNKDDDFKWFVNRWAVNIVNKNYLMNKFLAKESFELLNKEKWTLTEVTI